MHGAVIERRETISRYRISWL